MVYQIALGVVTLVLVIGFIAATVYIVHIKRSSQPSTPPPVTTSHNVNRAFNGRTNQRATSARESGSDYDYIDPEDADMRTNAHNGEASAPARHNDPTPYVNQAFNGRANTKPVKEPGPDYDRIDPRDIDMSSNVYDMMEGDKV